MPAGGIVADDPVRRLVGCAVHPYFLDGPSRGAHAMLDARAFEGRSGRAGAREHPVTRAQGRLAVGADVEKERQLFRRAHARTDDAGADVRADIAGHAGQAVDCGARMNGETQFAGLDRRRLIHSGDEGREPDRLGRQAQEEVHHGAVAGHGRLVDVIVVPR